MNDTPILSKLKLFTVASFEKGYRISPCGRLFSPRNKIMKPCWHKKGNKKNPLFYAKFSFKGERVYWHHLVAYQKFKDKWLYSDLLIRHLNGNSQDNSYSNISLGTQRENTMDIPLEKRKRNLKNAHLALRRFSNDQIKEIKELLKSKTGYRIAKLFNCSTKTIYDIRDGFTYKN